MLLFQLKDWEQEKILVNVAYLLNAVLEATLCIYYTSKYKLQNVFDVTVTCDTVNGVSVSATSPPISSLVHYVTSVRGYTLCKALQQCITHSTIISDFGKTESYFTEQMFSGFLSDVLRFPCLNSVFRSFLKANCKCCVL